MEGAAWAAVAVDAGRRLVRRSRCSCGTGLPAHSPVTAGKEVAPRLGDGEMTLQALFSEAVMMLGCPEQANTQGGEKQAWVLPSCTARHHPGFAAFSVFGRSTDLLERDAGKREIKDQEGALPQTCSSPVAAPWAGICQQMDVFLPSSIPMGCNTCSLHHHLCPRLLVSWFRCFTISQAPEERSRFWPRVLPMANPVLWIPECGLWL